MCKPHKMNHAGGMKLEGSRTRLAAEQTRREALAHTHQTSHG